METVRLGKTGIVTNKNGFGALPIQRVSDDTAVYLLCKAYENGITFFDTARWYTDSEHKSGLLLQEGGIKSLLLRRQEHRTRRISGRISRRVWIICRQIILIYTSSIIRRSVRSREMRAACMTRRLRRKKKERYDISVLRIIVWRWRTRRLTADCMRRCSFRSVIWRLERILNWWKNVSRQTWDLLP